MTAARADAAELAEKAARVREVAAQAGADAVLLTSSTSLPWLFDGARFQVSIAGPPVAQAIVHPQGVALGVYANEAERLVGEEIGELAAGELRLTVHPVPWFEPMDPTRWFPSFHSLGVVSEDAVAPAMRAARAPLLPTEEARFRALCAEAALVLTDTLTTARPTLTEADLAAQVTAGLAEIGAEPLVVLVAGELRLRYRHPLPTHTSLGSRGMVVVCTRRHGMIANLTRWVDLGAPSGVSPREQDAQASRDADGHLAIAEVEADVLDALHPDVPLAALLDVLRASYPRHGFAEDEWKRHHQGGAAGYAGRDPRLAPGIPDVVASRQAFAFNPTAPGAKIEDTVLLGPDGVEVLTTDPRWPARTVRGRLRPEPLRLH